MLEPAYQNLASSRLYTDRRQTEKEDATSLAGGRNQQPLLDNTSTVPIVSKELTSSIFMRGGTTDNVVNGGNNVDVDHGELDDELLDQPVNNPKSASFDDCGGGSHALREAIVFQMNESLPQHGELREATENLPGAVGSYINANRSFLDLRPEESTEVKPMPSSYEQNQDPVAPFNAYPRGSSFGNKSRSSRSYSINAGTPSNPGQTSDEKKRTSNRQKAYDFVL